MRLSLQHSTAGTTCPHQRNLGKCPRVSTLALAVPPGGAHLARDISRAQTAKDKLSLLELLSKQRDSLSQANAADVNGTQAPRMVDARMYNSAVQAQRRLAEKLSEANSYALVLEQKLSEYDKDLEIAATVLKDITHEFGTTGRLAEAAAAAVQFAVDQQDSITKITKLRARLAVLEKAMQTKREAFQKRVPRKVPVKWVGPADEVKLAGSFNGWTRGVDLSSPDTETSSGDSVLRTFQGTISLLPGRYEVKFQVDGEWRLAPDWPMEQDEKGETNNVLTVT